MAGVEYDFEPTVLKVTQHTRERLYPTSVVVTFRPGDIIEVPPAFASRLTGPGNAIHYETKGGESTRDYRGKDRLFREHQKMAEQRERAVRKAETQREIDRRNYAESVVDNNYRTAIARIREVDNLDMLDHIEQAEKDRAEDNRVTVLEAIEDRREELTEDESGE